MRRNGNRSDTVGSHADERGSHRERSAAERESSTAIDEQSGTGALPLRADGGSQWTDLTGFQRDLIKTIRRSTRHGIIPTGQAIKSDMEERYGESITNGRLYQNLNHLVDRDLLEKGFVDGRTNTYCLTKAGDTMLDETVHRFVDDCGIEIATLQE